MFTRYEEIGSDLRKHSKTCCNEKHCVQISSTIIIFFKQKEYHNCAVSKPDINVTISPLKEVARKNS